MKDSPPVFPGYSVCQRRLSSFSVTYYEEKLAVGLLLYTGKTQVCGFWIEMLAHDAVAIALRSVTLRAEISIKYLALLDHGS